MLNKFYSGLNTETIILISIAIILVSGFLISRLTNLVKLPKVSGYILAGVVIGPCLLNLVPKSIISNTGFLSDIVLAFIAFNVGKFFKKETIKKAGKKVIVITVFEALLAGILVTVFTFLIFRLDFTFCLLLGAIATATAPASTMMTINQYHARGEFVDVLLQIVALDDVVCLLVFSAVSAVITANAGAGVTFLSVALPIIYNFAAIGLGFLVGFLLSKAIKKVKSSDSRIILLVLTLVVMTAVCAIFNVSSLLACMIIGAVYINKTKDKELFHQMNNFTPPIFCMFFVLSGMNLDIKALGAFGLVGVAYFFLRIIGKYFGAFVGCQVTHTEKATRNYLGMALIPQAGVAIGLAFMAERILPPEIGSLLLTIILASSVLYELVGPALAKFALIKSGSIKPLAPLTNIAQAPTANVISFPDKPIAKEEDKIIS